MAYSGQLAAHMTPAERLAYRQWESFVSDLSPRQRDTLRLTLAGYSEKEICREIGGAIGTIKVHRAALLMKSGAASAARLQAMAGASNLAMRNAYQKMSRTMVPTQWTAEQSDRYRQQQQQRKQDERSGQVANMPRSNVVAFDPWRNRQAMGSF